MEMISKNNTILTLISLSILYITLLGCTESKKVPEEILTIEQDEIIHQPEYFSLRPEIEKAFGYSHAVRIGNIIKISGAVSMDENGQPISVGDMGQQIINIYTDLGKILKQYNCTFDDVIKENIFTTDMSLFLKHAAYRKQIYPNQFPTGTWLGVQELAAPVFLVEIELEVYKPVNN